MLTFLVAVMGIEILQHCQDNTLLNNRRWIVWKKRLATELMDVMPYLNGTQALAGNRLNLHAWHGYQEVLYRNKLEPREVSFDFFLGPEAYLVFVFNKDYTNFHGIRFSAAPSRPGAFLFCDLGGKFLAKEPSEPLRVPSGVKHHACVRFNPQGVHVTLDGASLGDFSCPLKPSQWIGFRGGSQTAWIDNVVIRDKQTGRYYRENFRNLNLSTGSFVKTALLALLVQGILFGILFLWHRNRSAVVSSLIAVNLCVISGVFAANFFITHVNNTRYPVLRGLLLKKEKHLLEKRLVQTNQELSKTYLPGNPEGIRRILFLGSSQTFGCGAQEPEECFVSLLEARLNQTAAGGKHFECLKAAIPGATSTELLYGYEQGWKNYAPELVVVNLGCNDRNPETFADNLRRIAALNQEAGIKTLFVLEALSDETAPNGSPNYAIMTQVAQELKVPLFNGYECLHQRRDDGFLFWDVVHLTSFGHQVAEQCMEPVIRELLGTS